MTTKTDSNQIDIPPIPHSVQISDIDFIGKMEQKLVKRINQWRYHTDTAKLKIEKLINKHKNEENKTSEFDKINKVIKYKKDENLTRLLTYLEELGKNTEILPAFTF